jgi:hypothetical protein
MPHCQRRGRRRNGRNRSGNGPPPNPPLRLKLNFKVSEVPSLDRFCASAKISGRQLGAKIKGFMSVVVSSSVRSMLGVMEMAQLHFLLWTF